MFHKDKKIVFNLQLVQFKIKKYFGKQRCLPKCFFIYLFLFVLIEPAED